jgi:hypothetical protein
MNVRKLKEAEAAFLARFPEGFDDPGLAQIRKTHNVEKLADFARENLTETAFCKPQRLADTVLKIVSRSSMVSRFEKPPFREFLDALDSKDKRSLADAFRRRLIGTDKRAGFEELLDLLGRYKLARWSLVSAVPFYFAPRKEAFVKPTTARRIVAYLEMDDLRYEARPSWPFYEGYRKLIRDIKKEIDPSLTPHNAAVTGFLMASM